RAMVAVEWYQSGSGAFVIKQKHRTGKPLGIETITEREGAQPRDDDPERVDLLSPGHRQNRNRPEPKQGHCDPDQFLPQAHPPGSVLRRLNFATIGRR